MLRRFENILGRCINVAAARSRGNRLARRLLDFFNDIQIVLQLRVRLALECPCGNICSRGERKPENPQDRAILSFVTVLGIVSAGSLSGHGDRSAARDRQRPNNDVLCRSARVRFSGLADVRYVGLGDPGRIRTCDLQLRRLLLYPLSYGATQAVSLYKIQPENAR
jgi:hypothetical protein